MIIYIYAYVYVYIYIYMCVCVYDVKLHIKIGRHVSMHYIVDCLKYIHGYFD